MARPIGFIVPSNQFFDNAAEQKRCQDGPAKQVIGRMAVRAQRKRKRLNCVLRIDRGAQGQALYRSLTGPI